MCLHVMQKILLNIFSKTKNFNIKNKFDHYKYKLTKLSTLKNNVIISYRFFTTPSFSYIPLKQF